MSPNFDKAEALRMSKADWVKQHEHMADEFDLPAEWESAQPKKVEKPKEDRPKTEDGANGVKGLPA